MNDIEEYRCYSPDKDVVEKTKEEIMKIIKDNHLSLANVRWIFSEVLSYIQDIKL